MKLLIRIDEQIDCQKIIDHIDKLSNKKKLNYEICKKKL